MPQSPGRERPFKNQVSTQLDGLATIHTKKLDRNASGRRSTGEIRPIPCEMTAPAILSRIEQTNHPPGPRIHAGDVRPLVAVAEETGASEIPGHGEAVMLLRNDMINSMGKGEKACGSWQYSQQDLARRQTSRSSVRFIRGIHAGALQGKPGLGPQDTKPVADPPKILHLDLLRRRKRPGLGFG